MNPCPHVGRGTVIHAVMALVGTLLLWACLGRLDIVATAPGRLVPLTYDQDRATRRRRYPA